MKLSKRHLKQIIKEEYSKILKEMTRPRNRRIAKLWDFKKTKSAIIQEPVVQDILAKCAKRRRWKNMYRDELESFVVQWVKETGVKFTPHALTESIIDYIDDASRGF